eukprot:TRINITY_DN9429_c0_g1_i1.p1 TRINITY_DN9429_c0_g1~~TRINITY_DN9429_c0_g1_i1.p1  ORF type:complete len:208 (-),score=24.51 TRINITY_DN9429_c0_g1_i1:15-638(-)
MRMLLQRLFFASVVFIPLIAQEEIEVLYTVVPFLIAVYLSEQLEKTFHLLNTSLLLLAFVFSTLPVKAYLFFIALIKWYLNEDSPQKEILKILEIGAQYSVLGIGYELPSIFRHVITGTVTDIEKKEDHQKTGRLTFPMHPKFKILYLLVIAAFVICTNVPYYSTVMYVFIVLHFEDYPYLVSLCWNINYVVELYFRSQIHFDYRYA